MKLTHPAVIAFGLAMLPMLPVISPLIEPTHSLIYHFDGPSSAVFYPVIIGIGLLWIMLTGVLMLARRPGRARLILWSALIFMLPWVILKVCAILLDWPMPHRLSLLVFLTGLVATAILLACWKPSFQHLFDQVQEFTATLLAFCALSGLLVLGHLFWSVWQTRSTNAAIPLHSRAVAQSTPHPRVIWLILDELSYRQVYEHRFPSLQLPAFDRLAAQSTLFTQVAPAGLMTEYAIPSLISALPADAMRASADGHQLYLRDPAQKRWQTFDPHQTVFQDALDRGYSTGISGWYNPYCRLLSPVLDHCFWTNHYLAPGGMSTHQTLLANIAALFGAPGDKAQHFIHWHKQQIATQNDPTETQAHIQDYTDLLTASDAMLNDSSVDLLFLHMPIPHPHGIYNRHTHQLTTTGSSTYIDNLALADAYVAHLRAQLEQRGQWDSSTILIMGDHSWRTAPIWALTTPWSTEEQDASNGGQFDDRPAYILKLPHQQQAARIDAPYPATRTRALIDALMDQRIKSPQDLEGWVANPSSSAGNSAAQ
jgi:Sulfatase